MIRWSAHQSKAMQVLNISISYKVAFVVIVILVFVLCLDRQSRYATHCMPRNSPNYEDSLKFSKHDEGDSSFQGWNVSFGVYGMDFMTNQV